MSAQAMVIWDPSFTAYDFGPTHPMQPVRLDLTARLCEAFGLFDHDDVAVVNPPVASDDVLARVHDPDYIAAVRRASTDPQLADPLRGLGTPDDPAFVGMHEASARVVAGTERVCQAVWEGEVEHGVNFCGGLHHAMRGHASGFCIYNDVAVGISWLLDHGAERVAYVDIDVHHGDGVEAMFWDDPRVLTISMHETGRILFPGTGWATDVGGGSALGTAVNVSVPPGLGIPGGSGHSMPGYSRSSGPSGQRFSSPSTGPTRTPVTRWRIWRSPWMRSARRRWTCTVPATTSATAGGWLSAAAGTRSSTSCRAPGPT